VGVSWRGGGGVVSSLWGDHGAVSSSSCCDVAVVSPLLPCVVSRGGVASWCRGGASMCGRGVVLCRGGGVM
jgi:hypothetical protein